MASPETASEKRRAPTCEEIANTLLRLERKPPLDALSPIAREQYLGRAATIRALFVRQVEDSPALLAARDGHDHLADL